MNKTKKNIKIKKKETKKIIKLKRKQKASKLDQYILDFLSLDDQRLNALATNIIDQLSNIDSENTLDEIEDLEIQLEAIKYIIDQKSVDQKIEQGSYNYYPDFNDHDFNEKIFKKKEFYVNRIPSINIKKKDGFLDIQSVSDKMCIKNNKNPDMVLSNNQIFLRNLISPSTPYNGILLFHGTGVGKTCSSISIAEEFSDELLAYNKKIIILSNPSIKSNFMKNIFDINSVKKGKPLYQCTKDKYIKQLNLSKEELKKLKPEELKQKIFRRIRKKYDFFGYQEFANKIEKIVNKPIQPYLKNKFIKETIHDTFSNSVIIIDEAHNIKQGNDMKKVPPMLEQVLKNSENTKLILLSATPMFDNATEIVWMMNLLLLNDKRPLLSKNKIFKNDKLTEEGKEILLRKSKGYVSYLRGENILKFPKRLYPSIYQNKKGFPRILKDDDFPFLNMKQLPIQDSEKIKHLKIIGCPMTDHQLTYYNNMEENDNYGSFLSNGLMLSNIVFPSQQLKNVEDEDSFESLSSVVGNTGFKNTFTKMKKSGSIHFRIKHKDNKDHMEMFKLENLKKYSSKIASIIENIKTSEGVIFIYSKYIYSGIVPLALALEYNGYQNYKKQLLDMDKNDPVLIKDDQGGNHEAKYIIISGTQELGRNAYDDYLKAENQNKNGEKIKIILGTETAAEGLDFKNIREIHILDPWHHLNKLEQIIGRGIRNCSHVELPFEKRNVVVNLYASIKTFSPSEEDIETVDISVLRSAENKAVDMAEVENILKTNAVDCNLNIEGNKFLGPNWKGKIKMISPKNTTHTDIEVGDSDFSRMCNYKECNYKCLPDLSEKYYEDSELDNDTFENKHILEQSYEFKKRLKDMFLEDVIYSIDDITNTFPEVNRYILLTSLQSMVDDKELFLNMYDVEGYIENKNNKYIFKPKYLEKQLLNIDDVRRPLTKKRRGINITNYYKTQKKVVKTTTQFDINMIINNIRQNYYFLIRDVLGRDNIWFEAKNNLSKKGLIQDLEGFSNSILKSSFNFFVYGQNNNFNPLLKFNQLIAQYLSSNKNIYSFGFSETTINYIEKTVKLKTKAKAQKRKIKIDEIDNLKNMLAYKTEIIKNRTNPIEKLNKLLLECDIDWMPSLEKEFLIRELLKNDSLRSENNDIFSILSNTNLIYYNNVYYKDPKFKTESSNKLYGYKIVKNNKLIYYKFQDDEFTKCNREETNQIKKSLRKKIIEEKINVMEKIGYLEEKMPEKKVILKIRDTKGQGELGTQKRKGSVCGSDGMKKGFITKYLSDLPKAENIETDVSKDYLCIIIELILRTNNKKKFLDTFQHRFYNVEETLEYNF
jgi:hypothetical protein